MKTTSFILFCCITLSTLPAQKPLAVVLDAHASGPDARAARVLQAYLQKITGQAVPLETTPDQYAPVFVGPHPALKKYGFQMPAELTEDAYS
ncbi:MAG: hypothetical protein KA165_05400, partial [Saprospiraceae bacterium]|nr:hypothetical protein [Saprospiraceae bacterium]